MEMCSVFPKQELAKVCLILVFVSTWDVSSCPVADHFARKPSPAGSRLWTQLAKLISSMHITGHRQWPLPTVSTANIFKLTVHSVNHKLLCKPTVCNICTIKCAICAPSQPSASVCSVQCVYNTQFFCQMKTANVSRADQQLTVDVCEKLANFLSSRQAVAGRLIATRHTYKRLKEIKICRPTLHIQCSCVQ